MRSPLDDDSPSGRLLSTTPISSATLTPPCNTVSPRTKDSGIPSRTEPNTMASPEPDACAPEASLRSPPPFRSSNRLPAPKAAAPINVNRPTFATSACLRASSINSNEIDPINRPAPSAITTRKASRWAWPRTPPVPRRAAPRLPPHPTRTPRTWPRPTPSALRDPRSRGVHRWDVSRSPWSVTSLKRGFRAAVVAPPLIQLSTRSRRIMQIV